MRLICTDFGGTTYSPTTERNVTLNIQSSVNAFFTRNVHTKMFTFFSAKALTAIETLTKCGTNDFGSNGDQVRKFARDALAMIIIDNQSYNLLHEQYNLGKSF